MSIMTLRRFLDFNWAGQEPYFEMGFELKGSKLLDGPELEYLFLKAWGVNISVTRASWGIYFVHPHEFMLALSKTGTFLHRGRKGLRSLTTESMASDISKLLRTAERFFSNIDLDPTLAVLLTVKVGKAKGFVLEGEDSRGCEVNTASAAYKAPISSLHDIKTIGGSLMRELCWQLRADTDQEVIESALERWRDENGV